MRERLMTLCIAAALAACKVAPVVSASPAAKADVYAVTEQPQSRLTERPALSPALLPSVDRTGKTMADTVLLQRPKTGSVVLKPLLAGSAVKVLGTLDNADGQWLSVGFDDLQGWVRAAEIVLSP